MLGGNIQKVAIIRFSAFGDIVRIAPSLNAVRGKFPGAKIDFIVARGMESLLDGCPYIDRTLPYNRIAGLRGIPSFMSFCKMLRANRYDLIVDMQDNTRSRNMAALAKSRFRSPSLDKSGVHLPLIAQYREILKKTGIETTEEQISFWISDSDRDFLKSFEARAGKPLIGFCLVGAWKTKHWPADSYAELGIALKKKMGATIVLIGGRGDAAEAAAVEKRIGGDVINMAGKTTLSQSVALTRLCAAVVSNDSGLMHAAAAVGVPAIGLFGCTDSKFNAPAGADSTALTAGLSCAPCHKPVCPLGTVECMAALPHELVLSEVMKVATCKE